MCKIKIEDLLGDFYKELMDEYQKESKEYHKKLYDCYIPKSTQEALGNDSCKYFYSNYCQPSSWKAEIQLFVDVFHQISIYFSSPTDLKSHVNLLVSDDNFRELVKVAFYISETISPKD